MYKIDRAAQIRAKQNDKNQNDKQQHVSGILLSLRFQFQFQFFVSIRFVNSDLLFDIFVFLFATVVQIGNEVEHWWYREDECVRLQRSVGVVYFHFFYVVPLVTDRTMFVYPMSKKTNAATVLKRARCASVSLHVRVNQACASLFILLAYQLQWSLFHNKMWLVQLKV